MAMFTKLLMNLCVDQVGWDESTAGERPNRVSIWEIEPVTSPFYICPPPFLRPKFARQPGLPGMVCLVLKYYHLLLFAMLLFKLIILFKYKAFLRHTHLYNIRRNNTVKLLVFPVVYLQFCHFLLP